MNRNAAAQARCLSAVLAVSAGLLSTSAAHADAPSGKPPPSFTFGTQDWTVNIDAVLRYNFGLRASPTDKDISLFDLDGPSDRKFGQGDVVNSRFSMLTSFDVAYRKDWGVHVSGDVWYDPAYTDDSVPNSPIGLANPYPSGHLTDRGQFLYRGPGGQTLEAYAYGKVPLSPSSYLSLQVGQQSVRWGVALFDLNSLGYSQTPINLLQLAQDPLIDPVEIFEPVNQLDMTAHLGPDWSILSQYIVQYRPSQFPLTGTYAGSTNNTGVLGGAPQTDASQVYGVPGSILQRAPNTYSSNSGNFGFGVKWSPTKYDSLALYYRRFHDFNFYNFPRVNLADKTLQYFWPQYSSQIIGLSANKLTPVGLLGAELTYQKDFGLSNSWIGLGTSLPTDEPRGDMLHLTLNLASKLPLPLWDDSTFVTEFNFTHRLKVSTGDGYYFGVGYGCGRAPAYFEASDGCSTRNSAEIHVLLEPIWHTRWPKLVISAPWQGDYGVLGTSPYNIGSYHELLTYTAGLRFTYAGRHELTLQMAGLVGPQVYRNFPIGGSLFQGIGPSFLDDRQTFQVLYKFKL